MISNFFRTKTTCVLALMLVMVFLPAFALAQSQTDGAIGGTVTDQSGAVVAGATVTARNLGTNATANATSDSSGGYRVVHLQPGRYELNVAAGNFAGYKQNVVVEVGVVTTIDPKLGVMGKSESIEVTAEAPTVNTEQQDFSTNINQTSINELPINGRRWSNFAVLTPGVVPDGNFGLLSFRGISGLLNNNTIDGGDHNQAFFSEEVGRTRLSYSISQDSIREFQVNTSNYSAEYGRAAGGVVNAVTKSGTNNIHGSAFYFNRDANLGATNPFTQVAVNQGNGVFVIQPVKPKDKRQQFGASVGGPIIKDKVFFFFSYDQQKRVFPGIAIPSSPTTFLAAPTAAELTTLTTRLGSAAAAQAAATNGLNFIQSITGTVPRRGDQIIFLPKIDWNISPNETFSVVYNRARWTSPAGIQTGAAVGRGVASFGNDLVHDDSVTGKLVSLLTPHISNEARFTYSRDNEFEFTQAPAPGEFLTGPGGSAVDVDVLDGNGEFEFGKPTFLNRRALPDETRYQYFDAVNISWGKHLFKVGGDINHVNDLEDSLFTEGGSYVYSTRVDFFTDAFAFQNKLAPGANVCNGAPVGRCYNSFAQGFGPTAFEFQTNDYNFFAQDDWRLLPRLTLNLGVRYEYEKLPSPQLPNPLLPNTGNFPSQKHDFGPRIGFAWDMFGTGKTALRGGYGIYYGRVINSTIANAITNTGLPTGQIQVSPTPTTAGAPTFPFTLAAGSSPGGGNVVQFDPNFKNPLIHQADLVLEQQIGTNMVFSASYLLSLGRHLPNFVDTNLNVPTTSLPFTVIGGPFGGQTFTSPIFTGKRPNSSFGAITDIISNVNSTYNAAVVQLNRRLTSGLQFQTNYTWSHAIDQGQVSQTFTGTNFPQNPFNQAPEKGNSNFDVRNRFVASIVWTADWKAENWAAKWLVNGFELAPVFVASSGRPISDSSAVSGSLPFATGRTTFGILGAGGSNRPFFQQRNTLIGPGLQDLDLRAAKNFTMGDRFRLQVSAEAFNLFNHEIFSSTSTNQYRLGGTATNPTLTFNPGIGTPTGAQSTLYRERNLQLGARITF